MQPKEEVAVYEVPRASSPGSGASPDHRSEIVREFGFCFGAVASDTMVEKDVTQYLTPIRKQPATISMLFA